jgi:Na+-translocating ferredoxin:NAD+ oxidoreductase RnfD subunit
LIGFVVQGELRCLMNGLPMSVGVVPMTGVSFVLFTFYMVTDPGSTPTDWREQVVFGAAVSLVYSLLVLSHIGFAFFYALLIVCSARGLILHFNRLRGYLLFQLPGDRLPTHPEV